MKNSDTRTKNGIRNIGAAIVNSSILLLLPFITRTAIIRILGSNYLGLSSLFSSIFTVLNLADLGFGSALVFSMYKPVADNDKEKVSALLNMYRRIYYIIGIVIFIAGLTLMPFLHYLIKGPWPINVNIYLLYLIYLINTSISYFIFSYKQALFIAYQRSDILSNIKTIISLAIYTLQLVILITIRNYYVYVIVLPVFTIIENIITAVIANRLFPDLSCKGKITIPEKRIIRDHVKGIALQKICSVSRNSFDSIVISFYLGLTTVAIYGNYYYIMSSIHNILYLIPNSIRASVGNSIACESVEKNYRDFKVISFIYMWLSGWCCICLLCLYQPFMQLWMGNHYMFPPETMLLFCFYFYELSMSDIISLYKDGAGLWWYGRYRTIIEAVANLVLNFVLGAIWGVNGIIAATIITIFFLGLGYGGYIVYAYYFKTKKFSEYILSQLSNIGITAFAGAITLFSCFLLPTKGIMNFLCRVSICIIIPNIIFWVIYRKLKYYAEAKRFVHNMKQQFTAKNL